MVFELLVVVLTFVLFTIAEVFEVDVELVLLLELVVLVVDVIV